jgi:hypothetical protein
MNVTIDQAIEIFARGMRHRKGKNASRSAWQEAQRLKAAGDMEGHDVWTKVARLIDELSEEAAAPVQVN